MSPAARLVAILGALVLLLQVRGVNAAWIETRVKAHTAVVDVGRSGSAVVTHEIVLGVRGGPLRDWEVQGVDLDAEPIGTPTVMPAGRTKDSDAIPLVVSRRDDGTLKLEVQHEKGLRTGSYTFSFQYKTELLARDRVRRRGASAEVEWVGPRFDDGVDVAKVIFRLPEGPVAPVLPSGTEADDSVMGSAFVASSRHESGKAIIEIVRPHVARGEPAVWRVLTSPKCFDGLQQPTVPTVSSNRVVAVERPRERLGWLGAGLALALAYGGLVLFKWWLYRKDCEGVGAQPVAWVRIPVQARAALSGAMLAAAALLGAHGEHPTTSAFLLVLSMAFAGLRAPRVASAPRGPGQWLALTDGDAFTGGAPRFKGRWLDAGTATGFGVLAVVLGASALGVARLAPHSPYHALAAALLLAALLPIFGTGRIVGLPVNRAVAPRRFLWKLARGLRRRSGVKAIAWARIPDGQSEPDELRLLVRLARSRDGLFGIEVGLEYPCTASGVLELPFVLVRVREDSQAQAALPRTIVWQRGRRPEERVAILRPTLPTVELCASLIETVADQLSPPERSSSRKTSGASASTLKARVRSPAHAM